MKFWCKSAPVRARRRPTQCVALLSIACGAMMAAAGEVYRPEPMPSGFRVEATELEGPVFADERGMTLYSWPQHKLRNGYSGEAAGTPSCYDDVITVTAGLMSPYPPGITLPEADRRPSCTDLWPPALAGEDAQEVGKWSVVERADGTLQWAYDEQPLYTSILDREPGDTLGGSRRKRDSDAPASRIPVAPAPLLPPGFSVKSLMIGRMLTTASDEAVYSFDEDTEASTACSDSCLDDWKPVLAPEMARSMGEWSVLDRAPGVRQWVFRGKPLYTHRPEEQSWGQSGSDVPGWRNVFTHKIPAFPTSFTVQPTLSGEVLADSSGKTIYIYQCGEDSADQLACDHPSLTQVYRLAMCGGADPARCLQYWPYVPAEGDSETQNRSWSIVSIDPQSGRFAAENQSGALRVWAYRDRPIYTFAGDRQPGDVNGGGTGEWRGKRNGLLAFWLRDDLMDSTE